MNRFFFERLFKNFYIEIYLNKLYLALKNMQKVIISPEFDELSDFINILDSIYKIHGDLIKKGRNELKTFKVYNQVICVKSFLKITIANRIIYSFFRKSKAERSYLAAQKLLSLGIDTPTPIAFVETFNKCHFLKRHYYICKYQPPTLTLDNVINQDETEKNQILKQFSAFAIKLYNQGIIHRDFNATNIFINQNSNNTWQFGLIDLNRIRFKKQIKFKDALTNLSTCLADIPCLIQIGQYYSENINKNQNEIILKMLAYKYSRNHKKYLIKKFTKKLKLLFH